MNDSIVFNLLTSLVPLVILLSLIIGSIVLIVWIVKKFTGKRNDDKDK